MEDGGRDLFQRQARGGEWTRETGSNFLVSNLIPMKKLVAYLVPVTEPAASQQSPLPELSTDQAESGAMKVEALLSDSDAERVLTTISGCIVSSREQQFVTQLVDQELALAGPQADDLWIRIVAAVERKLICQVYADCDGVKTRAAARLGIDRNTLHKKLRQYDLIENGAAEPEIAANESPS